MNDQAFIADVVAAASVWTPEKVSERLIEAFRIDARMPRIERPKAPGSAHPTIEYDNDDRAEWQTEEINIELFRPSLAEEETAAEALGWFRLIGDEGQRVAVRSWARWRIRVTAEEELAAKEGREPVAGRFPWKSLGISRASFFDRRKLGMSAILSGLNGGK